MTEKYIYHWLTNNPVGIPGEKTRLINLFLCLNYFIVFIDVGIAHAFNRFFPAYEWIPIIYSPIAGIAVLLLALRPKSEWLSKINILIGLLGVLVGILGFGFHLQGVAAGTTFSFANLINSNPVFAPLAFLSLGALEIVAALKDHPEARKYDMTRKTRWLLLLTALWYLLTGITSFFDHAPTGFTNFFTWIPFYIGLFATLILTLQAFSRPDKGLSILFGVTMLVSIVVGLLGFAFHLSVDLAGRGSFSWTRFFYYAPGLAPLLFSDLGIWGLLVFLDPLPETNPSNDADIRESEVA